MPLQVCAVMITGKPGREYLARMAIESFQAQTYKPSRLLIVNDGAPLLNAPLDRVRELIAPPGMSLGRLRNFALDNMDRDVRYVVQWDDDDYSDPLRITWQVGQVKGGAQKATVLRFATHCNLHTGEMKICTPTRRIKFGFAGTMMHAVPTPYRYPDAGKAEDTQFTQLWRNSGNVRVLINDRFPTFYVRFFHGLNTWNEKHVMGFPTSGMKLSAVQRATVDRLRARYLSRLSAESCSPTPAAASCTP